MAGRKNPFEGYNEEYKNKEVQDITSERWEPISAGPTLEKNTPVRENANKKKNTRSGAAAGTSQTKKASGVDVTKDRISKGKPADRKKSEEGKKNIKKAGTAADNKKTADKKRTPEKGKSSSNKKTQGNNKAPVGSKKREPKGKDTRTSNVDTRDDQARKEKKRTQDCVRTTSKAREKRKDGVSYDEMRKEKIRNIRLKAKIAAISTVIITVIVLICFACFYAYQNGAIVSTINIEGENRYKDERITEAANIYPGINMLSVREKDVNEAVSKALPYIKNVQVDYQFPDTLVLNVTATEENMLIAGERGYICLDRDGKVLSLKKKKLAEGRYLVEGFEEQTATEGEMFVPTENNKERYEKAKAIISCLESSGKFSMGTINVANLNDITAVYDSRINIYLGDCSRLESQLTSAIDVIEVDEDIINGQEGYIETRFEGRSPFKPGSMIK